MGQIKDRVVGLLPVNSAKVQHPFLGQLFKHHRARLPHRSQLRRIAKQQQRREDLFQVLELFVVQHRTFIDKPDIQRFLATLPSGDEIAPAQPRSGQGTGNGFVVLVEREGAVQRDFVHPLDHRAFTAARQPFRDAFVFGVIDRRIEDAVDRRRGHTAQPQDRCRLVGGGQNGERALVFLLALVIARNDVDAGIFQRLVQFCQQQCFARPRLAGHRQHLVRPARRGHQQIVIQIDARMAQHLGHAVKGSRLIGGIGKGRYCHGATLIQRGTGGQMASPLFAQSARAKPPRDAKYDNTRAPMDWCAGVWSAGCQHPLNGGHRLIFSRPARLRACAGRSWAIAPVPTCCPAYARSPSSSCVRRADRPR